MFVTIASNDAWRCDTIATVAVGCIVPNFRPRVYFDATATPKVQPVAAHIIDALNRGFPGHDTPLTRTTVTSLINANRNTACPPGTFKSPDSCDEYPFASTYDGAQNNPYSIAPVPLGANSSQGGTLKNFYSGQRVIDGDEFFVDANDNLTGQPKVMVTGDSISQGLEGDASWRFRLYEHEWTNSPSVLNFVGPRDKAHNGYNNQSDAKYYSSAWDLQHDSLWGRQLRDAKTTIQAEAAAAQPDYVLVELGVNDLLWGVSTPDAVIADMRAFVGNLRLASPRVKVLIANLMPRSALPQLPNINTDITSYNSKLPGLVSSLNTSKSPVALVDLATGFNVATFTYDGLHPNGFGEHHIASRFADKLSDWAGVGSHYGPIPADVPAVYPTNPDFSLSDEQGGIKIRWDHAYGMSGIYVWSRDVTNGEPLRMLPLPISGTGDWLSSGLEYGHTYEIAIAVARGDFIQDHTATKAITAHPSTPTRPLGVTALPSASTIALSWAPPASGSATSYVVSWQDQTTTAFSSATVNSTSTAVSAVSGHRYNISVQASNSYGPGPAAGAPPILATSTAPVPPTSVSARSLDNASVSVTWAGAPTVPGFWIEQRNKTQNGPWSRLPFAVTGTTATIGSLWRSFDYEFRLVAQNGSYEAAPSTVVTGGAPPLDAPSFTSALELNGGADLSWTPVANGDGYYWLYVRDATAGQTQLSLLPYPVLGTNWRGTGYINGHQYCWAVQANDGPFVGPLSPQICVVPRA